jgi:hypothetical protein
VLLRRATVFDGSGGPPQTLDIAVRDGPYRQGRGVDLTPQARRGSSTSTATG